MREDITDTLESLTMVVEVCNKITICIGWSVVDAHIKRKNASKQYHIDSGRLRWTPPIKS